MMNFKHYRVTVENPGNLTEPRDGFIDHTAAEFYLASDDAISSLDAAMSKERANVRWNHLIAKFSELVAPVISNIETVGASANAEATSIEFTLVYDRPEYLRTQDETVSDGSFLSGADALKRLIARALTATINGRRQLMFPVDHTTEYSNDLVALVTGPIAEDMATAEALVTVEEIENV